MIFLLHIFILFSGLFCFEFMSAMNRNITYNQAPFSFVSWPIIKTISDFPIPLTKEALADNQFNFYYAVQHRFFKNCFFIVRPELKNREDVMHLVFDAFKEEKIFYAIVFNKQHPFIVDFSTMHTLDYMLKRK